MGKVIESQHRWQHVRIFERVQIPGRVYIHNEKRLFIAPLNNISGGGLFIDGLVNLPVGNCVRVVIKSAKLKTAIQAKGKIVRVESNMEKKGAAVQFLEVERRLIDLIENCVNENRVEIAA